MYAVQKETIYLHFMTGTYCILLRTSSAQILVVVMTSLARRLASKSDLQSETLKSRLHIFIIRKQRRNHNELQHG